MLDREDWLTTASDEELEEADAIVRGDRDEELKDDDSE